MPSEAEYAEQARAEVERYKQQVRDVADQMQTRYLELADMLAAVRQDQERVMTERDELRAEVTQVHRGLDAETNRAVAAEDENERLRAALTRYGKHLNLCSTYKDGPHQASLETVCDCGLFAAIGRQATALRIEDECDADD